MTTKRIISHEFLNRRFGLAIGSFIGLDSVEPSVPSSIAKRLVETDVQGPTVLVWGLRDPDVQARRNARAEILDWAEYIDHRVASLWRPGLRRRLAAKKERWLRLADMLVPEQP